MLVKQFTDSDKCAKCESAELKKKFCISGVTAGAAHSCEDFPKRFQHLHMECGDCGYVWISQTADHEDWMEAEREHGGEVRVVDTAD